MTPFGEFLDKSVRGLTREAVQGALGDAGCGVDKIDSAFFANAAQGAMDGQHSIRGERALRDFAFDNIPVVNVENACASALITFGPKFWKGYGQGEAPCTITAMPKYFYADDQHRAID